jgi:hypothetical protein
MLENSRTNRLDGSNGLVKNFQGVEKNVLLQIFVMVNARLTRPSSTEVKAYEA